MNENPTRLVEWLRVIRAEFAERSGLCLTAREAGARWPLEEGHLVGVLDALVYAGYLMRSSDGVYSRCPEDYMAQAPPSAAASSGARTKTLRRPAS